MTDIPTDFTSEEWRAMMDRLSDHIGEWQGVPVHLPDMPLVLHDRHPLARFFGELDGAQVDIHVGGPADRNGDTDEVIVNRWFCRQRQSDVTVWRGVPSGRRFATVQPRAPDGSMQRLTMWLSTIGASDAWDLGAEYKAREKLAGLLSERQWRHYDLTGAFFETSPRSRLTYVFRRLRPTIALTPRWSRPGIDSMRNLAILCLHPIGYYQDSWGGCMVPSDDVIAHVLAMRSDEAYFWRKANQHAAWRPEAGL